MILLRRLYHDGVPGPAHLLVEGFVAALLGTFFAAQMFPRHAGLVAIFLATLTATDSTQRMLSWHRWAITKKRLSVTRANVRLSVLLLSLFLGTLAGFTVLGLGLKGKRVLALFLPQLEGSLGRAFPDMVFGDPWALFSHNLFVTVFFFCIALPFRKGGVMLAIAWNASVWGVSTAMLARNWEGEPLALAMGKVVLALGPHMAIEAVAYTLAGLGGVFLSLGIERHDLGSPTMVNILRTTVGMLGIAAGLVAAGAVIEGTLAPWLVHWLSG